jgi:5-deoxy-D-glucuronate isomerase
MDDKFYLRDGTAREGQASRQVNNFCSPEAFGPSMAPPGYHLYYLNVMAGPSPDRAWRFCDDPAHAWVRGTWSGQAIDPRLPLTSATERKR